MLSRGQTGLDANEKEVMPIDDNWLMNLMTVQNEPKVWV
jgi:hypothetical protein